MIPRGDRRVAGAFSPIAIGLALLAVALGLSSIWIEASIGRWRADMLAVREEDLAAGTSIAQTIAAHLSKADWDCRFYAAIGGASPASTVEEGTFEGTDFIAVISDVPDSQTHQPIFGLTRVFLRLTRGGERHDVVAQLRWHRPTMLVPAAVVLERLLVVPRDLATREGRAQVSALLDADDAAREATQSADDVLIREADRVANSPARPSAAAVVASLLKADLTARVALERPVTDALRAGRRALLNNGREGALVTARQSYEAAVAAAALQTDPTDRAANTIRAGYGLAWTLIEIAQGCAEDAAGQAERAKLSSLAQESLAKVIATRPDGPLVPYAILAQARALRMQAPGSSGRALARQKLDALVPTYAFMYPYGVDRPVDGSVARNSLLDFEKMLTADVFHAVAGSSPFTVVAVRGPTVHARAVPLTPVALGMGAPFPAQPDKDLIATSPDGLVVGFRLHRTQGSKVVEKAFTMDFDGSNLRDVSLADPADASWGWRPPWFAKWRQAPASLPFPSVQPLLAECLQAATTTKATTTLLKTLDALSAAKGAPAAAKVLAGTLRKTPTSSLPDPAIAPGAASGALTQVIGLIDAASRARNKALAGGPDQASLWWNAWRQAWIAGHLLDPVPVVVAPVFEPEVGVPDPDERERQKMSSDPSNAGPDRDRDDR